MVQFDLPIMYRAEHYWNSGRMPSIDSTKPKVVTVMRRLQFCIEGIGKFFDIPNDAFMLQLVLSSERVPNSYEVKIDDDGCFNFENDDLFDWVVRQFGKAILNHSGNVSTWWVQCFYWVVE